MLATTINISATSALQRAKNNVIVSMQVLHDYYKIGHSPVNKSPMYTQRIHSTTGVRTVPLICL